jgi:hypothetical protein
MGAFCDFAKRAQQLKFTALKPTITLKNIVKALFVKKKVLNNLEYMKSHLCAVLNIFIKSPCKSFLKIYMPDYKLDSISRNVLVFNKNTLYFCGKFVCWWLRWRLCVSEAVYQVRERRSLRHSMAVTAL